MSESSASESQPRGVRRKKPSNSSDDDEEVGHARSDISNMLSRGRYAAFLVVNRDLLIFLFRSQMRRPIVCPFRGWSGTRH